MSVGQALTVRPDKEHKERAGPQCQPPAMTEGLLGQLGEEGRISGLLGKPEVTSGPYGRAPFNIYHLQIVLQEIAEICNRSVGDCLVVTGLHSGGESLEGPAISTR